MQSDDTLGGKQVDSAPSSRNCASATRASRAIDSASATLRVSDSSVCVWAATVPVGT